MTARSYDVARAAKSTHVRDLINRRRCQWEQFLKILAKPVLSFPKVLAWFDDLASTKVARLWYASANHKSGSSIFNHRPSVITQFHIRGALQWMNLDGIRRVSFFWSAHRVGVVWNPKLENFQCHPTGNSWRCSRKRKLIAVWYHPGWITRNHNNLFTLENNETGRTRNSKTTIKKTNLGKFLLEIFSCQSDMHTSMPEFALQPEHSN